jgi:hypothetical protein
MSDLIQLVYISRGAFRATEASGGVVPEVSKILQVSRRNNRARNIVGALYYGNGFFFQCLEGAEQTLMSLLETLKADPRHTNLRVVCKKPVTERSFGSWEMKYLPTERDVQALVRSFGMKAFDPFAFNETQTSQMLDMLAGGANLTLPETMPPRAAAAKKPVAPTSSKWQIGIGLASLAVAGILAVQYLK